MDKKMAKNGKVSSFPTTGQVLRFLVECFGESKGKGVEVPFKTRRRKNQSNSTKWAQLKRIQRLANQCRQKESVSREVESALIDTVAALFDDTLKGQHISGKVRKLSLGQRVLSAFPRLRSKKPCDYPFSVRLVFWIVFFIEHHEWHSPQLEAAHPPDKVLWEWVQYWSHFCSNTLADTVRVNPSMLDGLPDNLSWNLPAKQADGTVKWPMRYGFEWLESLMDERGKSELPAVLYPRLNGDESGSTSCFRRMMRGIGLPGVEKIEKVAQHHWKFRNPNSAISREKLMAVLLWCRALQYALKAVEYKFGMEAVWTLVEWHKTATDANLRFAALMRGGEKYGRTNAS